MENSLHVADSLGADHCLMERDKTMMIFSGRLEESLDSTLCSSDLRGAEELQDCKLLQDYCQLQN